jgi:pyruvate/2-oxoglutarate/acetoin dehydrogenase E1 component
MSKGMYKKRLVEAMNLLSENEKTIFLGQSVAVEGTAMRGTLLDIPKHKLLELPVEEDFQMGLANGLAISGRIPISVFPRWNFLLLATNQIVNHLNNFERLTRLSVPPKVIIRTGIGSTIPLHPGVQHVGDFTDAFKILAPNLEIIRLDSSEQIVPEYTKALERKDGKSTLLIEWSDKYLE